MNSDSLSVTKTIKGRLPNLPFRHIKEEVLGKDYNLSVVFIGEKKSRYLNKTYRNKDKPTNVLAFPLDKKNGEIFITPSVANKQSHLFLLTEKVFTGKLLIHAMLHLKGFAHGSTMESIEARFVKKFFQ